MPKKFQKQIFGHFRIDGKDQAGVIDLKGPNSKLEIYSDEFMFVDSSAMSAIHGISRDGSKVTACHCIGSEISGTAMYHGTSRHWMTLFPHFIAIGPHHHVSIDTNHVGRIEYTFPNAVDLFYDYKGFGMMHGKPELARIISEAAKKDGDLRDVRYYESFYFADRGPIVSVKNSALEINAYNSISYKFPSPRGIRLKNTVKVSIDFEEPQRFDDAFRVLHETHSFFNLLMQSKQPIPIFSIIYDAETEKQTEVYVYVSLDQEKNADKLDYRDFFDIWRF